MSVLAGLCEAASGLGQVLASLGGPCLAGGSGGAETHAFLAALHPLGRMGEISEIAEAILYLEDAAFVTGETLHVDGGQSASY